MSKSIMFLVGACLVVLATSALAEEFGIFTEDWINFKQTHGKSYSNRIEEITRASIFAKNKKFVDEFNANNENGFELGLNHLADLTESEYRVRLGFRNDLRKKMNSSKSNDDIATSYLNEILNRDIDVPESLDWRKTPGRVTKVKDQGTCGSCWAFSTTGVLEGQQLSVTGKKDLVPLSEQNLMDCSVQDYGCAGGLPELALQDIEIEGGIDDESSYPYHAKLGNCKFNKKNVVMTTNGAIGLKEGDEETLKKIVAKFGPVSVGIDASQISFKFYKTGVYKEIRCGNTPYSLDHAVLVVGYGSDDKEGDYWIVKNSWGEDWGDSGYVKMARNHHNMCGVATHANIAKF